MTISEIAQELTRHYREHKAANGGHKTSVEQYGYRSIQYAWVSPEGVVSGPFLGRGSLLRCIMSEKAKGNAVLGGRAVVQEIFTPKGKKVEGESKTEVVKSLLDVTRTARIKKEKPAPEAAPEPPAEAVVLEALDPAVVDEAYAEEARREKNAKERARRAAKKAEAPAEAPAEA